MCCVLFDSVELPSGLYCYLCPCWGNSLSIFTLVTIDTGPKHEGKPIYSVVTRTEKGRNIPMGHMSCDHCLSVDFTYVGQFSFTPCFSIRWKVKISPTL